MSDANEKRNVLLGVTASVAASRSVELARLLVSRGYNVRVLMDRAAEDFIGRLSFEVVTGHPVLVDNWGGVGREGINETAISDWADVIVIAPVTADCLAKINSGFSDSPLLVAVLASSAPLVLAPVLPAGIFQDPRMQSHFDVLYEMGAHIIFPSEDERGIGASGAGRMAHPWQIFYAIRRALSVLDFSEKHILITTGPTREYRDQVRYLSRHSSGKMGIALAREAYRRGAKVSLIHGPVPAKVPQDVDCYRVVTAQEMYDRVLGFMSREDDVPDVIVMAAAISDFRFADTAPEKREIDEDSLTVTLSRNKDILAALWEKRGKSTQPILVGFSEVTGDEEEATEQLTQKLNRKKVDLLIGQAVETSQTGGGYRVWMLDKLGHQNEVASSYKSRIVNKVLGAIGRLL